jgi:hypothetical protein
MTSGNAQLDAVMDYLQEERADAVIAMHRPDEVFEDEDIPEGWVLVKTAYVGGKRIRTFDIKDSNAREDA